MGFPQPSGETGGPPAASVPKQPWEPNQMAQEETRQELLPSLEKLGPGLFIEKPQHISLLRGKKEKGDVREREVGE